MTKQQLSRIRQFRNLVKKMPGEYKYKGNNHHNYELIAEITSSSVSTVKAWVGGYRVIPKAKLDLLKQRVA